jgi:hypothetical protein
LAISAPPVPRFAGDVGAHNRPEWLRQQQAQKAEIVDLKPEVVVVPVSNADRAQRFSKTLGCRLDIDHVASEDFRVVQLTPPRSECSHS